MLQVRSSASRVRSVVSRPLLSLLAYALISGAGGVAFGMGVNGARRQPCLEDAMIVLDASGSMAGTEYQGIGNFVTRMDNVRKALSRTLPAITQHRKVGLMSYGPGPYNKCDNIKLDVPPLPNAAAAIMEVVGAIVPAGRTPLTRAVELAAEQLRYKERPGVVVLLTDGEENCGGAPCELARRLASEAPDLNVHVIGYRVNDGMGLQGLLQSRCLADQTGGHFASVDSTDSLETALKQMLGCPMLTELPDSVGKIQNRLAERIETLEPVAVSQ